MLPTGSSGVERIFLGTARNTTGDPVAGTGADGKMTGRGGGGGGAGKTAGGSLIIRWPGRAAAKALGGSRIIRGPAPGAPPGARGVKLTAPIGVCWVWAALERRRETPPGPLEIVTFGV